MSTSSIQQEEKYHSKSLLKGSEKIQNINLVSM